LEDSCAALAFLQSHQSTVNCSNFNPTTLRLAKQKVQTVIIDKLAELNKCTTLQKCTTTKCN